MAFYKNRGFLVQTAAQKFTFYAELVASSSANLFKLSLKEKNMTTKHVRAEETQVEQRCTGSFGKMRLGPARERDGSCMSGGYCLEAD